MKISTLKRTLVGTATTAALAVVTACGAVNATDTETAAGGTTSSTSVAATAFTAPAKTHADSNDGDYTEAAATTIALANGDTQVDGAGASVKGDVVTITKAGTYIVSGTVKDGQIVVKSAGEGKVRIVLDNADIASASSSPIVIEQADEAVVILADGTTNSLADSTASAADDDEEDAPTATLFSTADLTIAGSGTLNVTGTSNDGVASKDGLVILSGTVNVTATDDGIRGKDYLATEGGTITVKAGGDGLKSDNETEGELGVVQIDDGSVTISAGDDGVDAVGAVNVASGKLAIKKSEEGLEAAQIRLAGGSVDVTAEDDGINATNGLAAGGGEDVQDGVQLTISGGDVHVVVSRGDGIDSNGTATITGGSTVVEAVSAEGGGTGAIDVNGSFPITGGNLVALGGLSSAPATDSTTGWVAASLTTAAEAGRVVAVVDSDGTVVARYVVPQATSSILVAAKAITSGENYTLYVGDAGAATGFSTGGSTDGLSKAGTVTAGEFTGGGGRGGPGGGGGAGGGGFGGNHDGGPPDQDNGATGTTT
jgi:Carbohydrate-binding domain-containing protein Cthe_2159